MFVQRIVYILNVFKRGFDIQQKSVKTITGNFVLKI